MCVSERQGGDARVRRPVEDAFFNAAEDQAERSLADSRVLRCAAFSVH